MENVVLEMRSVTKAFPGVKALDDVNLKVRAGEIHTICGENGAGKSTLMKVLSGAYPCKSYSGEIYVDGELCQFHTPQDSERKGIAMIYQEVNMHTNMSVAENFFSRLAGKTRICKLEQDVFGGRSRPGGSRPETGFPYTLKPAERQRTTTGFHCKGNLPESENFDSG